jgi:hypothetical protein
LDCITYAVEVRRRCVVSLIIPHIGYGGIVYAGVDAASQRRLNMAFRLTVHSFSEEA